MTRWLGPQPPAPPVGGEEGDDSPPGSRRRARPGLIVEPAAEEVIEAAEVIHPRSAPT